ncbi:hypothetical protein C1H46_003918 [Malus baccata]|uniref:Uncharacterized protein n=1 Tax=Malus baccata TaxID=106549 RepID=A0A540NIN3_MALBA|nr:hypothetical protein C1H46_003918 [Malus baccata]
MVFGWGLAVGHMGEGGDALRTHEAAQTLRVHHHQKISYLFVIPLTVNNLHVKSR